MSKFRLVIFDFDGTLANTYPWFIAVLNDVAEKFNFNKVEINEHEHLRRLNAMQIMAHLNVPHWKIPLIAKHMRQRMSDDLDNISLFNGIDALLKNIHDSGCETAIVSSNARNNVESVLGPINASRISYFACGASIFGKPSKLRKVIAKSGADKQKVIYVGDEIRDIEAAHSLRIPFCAVAWGYNDPNSLRAIHHTKVCVDLPDLQSEVL